MFFCQSLAFSMIQSVAPSLEGRFLTTGPPGKSLYFKFLFEVSVNWLWLFFFLSLCVSVCFIVRISHFSHSVVSNSLRPHEPQHARPPCPSPTAGVYPNPCPLSRWFHPLSSPSLPALNLSHQGLFKWVSSSHQVARVLEFQLQHQFFQWTPRTDLL